MDTIEGTTGSDLIFSLTSTGQELRGISITNDFFIRVTYGECFDGASTYSGQLVSMMDNNNVLVNANCINYEPGVIWTTFEVLAFEDGANVVGTLFLENPNNR